MINLEEILYKEIIAFSMKKTCKKNPTSFPTERMISMFVTEVLSSKVKQKLRLGSTYPRNIPPPVSAIKLKAKTDHVLKLIKININQNLNNFTGLEP